MEFNCILEGRYEGIDNTIFYITVVTPFKNIEGVELVTNNKELEARLKAHSKGDTFKLIGRPVRNNGAIRIQGAYAINFSNEEEDILPF